jgi:hypothetical protein
MSINTLKNVYLSAPPRREMTTEQLAEQNKKQKRAIELLKAQKSGRADAYGLIAHERFDDSNRKIREWSSVDGHLGWMAPFRQHIVHEQVRINNRETTGEENQAFLVQWQFIHKRG